MNPIKTCLTRRSAAVAAALLACVVAAGLASGCMKQDETPDAETHAAEKTIDNAKAEQADTAQRAKEADDLTKTGK